MRDTWRQAVKDSGLEQAHLVALRARQRRRAGGGGPQRLGARRAPRGQFMQLNLTAMVDVVLLLLIYFVISAGFARPQAALSAKLPTGSPASPDALALPQQKLTITLRSAPGARCHITVAGRRVASFTALNRTLAELLYDPAHGHKTGMYRPTNPLVIHADRQVRWQYVVSAFSAAVKQHYTNVAFAAPDTGSP